MSDTPRTDQVDSVIYRDYQSYMEAHRANGRTLERELNELYKRMEDAQFPNTELAISQLRARITELEQDKARLDWLDKQNDVVLERNTEWSCPTEIQVDNTDGNGEVYCKLTLRQAIDAAMKGDKG